MNASYWNIQYSELLHQKLPCFSPECTKIVSGWGSAPDPAGGAYSAPPDPLAVMGWDGDLVTTFWGVNYVPPCLWPVPPCCFEAGYGPGDDSIFTRITSILQYSEYLTSVSTPCCYGSIDHDAHMLIQLKLHLKQRNMQFILIYR